MKKIIAYTILSLFLPLTLSSQNTQGTSSYTELYEKKEYARSLAIINIALNKYYENKVENRRLPEQFITTRPDTSDIDLREIFRKRKLRPFHIEENEEMLQLHLYAARCYSAQNRHSKALSHYTQALRFTQTGDEETDVIYFEMSRVYRTLNRFEGYLDALEMAYTINPENYSYSRELGLALVTTTDKKKARFHLERYLENSADTVEPGILRALASLSHSLRDYLSTEEYLLQYLKQEPDDVQTLFALGDLAYRYTGHHDLAEKTLSTAVKELPEEKAWQKSKALEYLGDIARKDLRYAEAIERYIGTIQYQSKTEKEIDSQKKKIEEMRARINELKAALIKKPDFTMYEEHGELLEKKGEAEQVLFELEKNLRTMNPGKVRWNLAWSYEQQENYEKAIEWYRNSIQYNYRNNDARERIVKLKLKRERGY